MEKRRQKISWYYPFNILGQVQRGSKKLLYAEFHGVFETAEKDAKILPKKGVFQILC
jgi:hypothetical protein